jgi:hypothetical protein
MLLQVHLSSIGPVNCELCQQADVKEHKKSFCVPCRSAGHERARPGRREGRGKRITSRLAVDRADFDPISQAVCGTPANDPVSLCRPGLQKFHCTESIFLE